ncbi:MAG: AraC-like DNA-binding protein [Halioglobus sp.]|jgi:AraC-like DNA-binding protein
MSKNNSYYIDTEEILSILEPSIEKGLSVEALLRSLNLPLDLLKLPNERITLADGWRITTAHQSIIQEETHLMSRRPLKRGTTRFVFSNLVRCKTLLEGLEMLADTYNIIHGGNYNFVKRRGNCLSYIVEDSEFHYREHANNFAIEFALIMIHCAITYMAGHRINPVKVCSKREKIVHQNHHLNVFSCNTHFGHPHYELAYDISAANTCFRPVEDIDLSVHLLEYCIALADEHESEIYETALIQRVSKHIEHGVHSQADISTALGMSVATLRRKLKSQGTNFRTVLDKVSSELAVAALIDQRSVDDVAEQLGYCDIRSFKRAFKRWQGISPAAFLRENKAGSTKFGVMASPE